MRRYITRVISRIRHPQPERQKLLQGLAFEAHSSREKALKQFRQQGLTGKDYSDAVVKFDKELTKEVSKRQETIMTMYV